MTTENVRDPAVPAGDGGVAADLRAAGPGGASTPAPPAELLLAARFDAGPDYLVRRDHGAPSWLVAWTVAGAGRFRQGQVELRAGPGELVALGPDVAHEYGVALDEGRWSFWWAHCPARASWSAWLRPYDRGDGVHHVTGVPGFVHARIETAFRELHANARWSGRGPLPEAVGAGVTDVPAAVAAGTAARELALGRVDEVVVLATAAATAATADQGGPHGVDPRVSRVEALVAADPAAPHSVRSLAAHVALSPSRLAHLFTAETGRTPMRAVREARLRHAALLLETTDLPVARVAAAAGFGSAFHFSRLFRRRFGVPPGAYRARSR